MNFWFDDHGTPLEPGDWVDVNEDLRCMISEDRDDRYLAGLLPGTIIRSMIKVEDEPVR